MNDLMELDEESHWSASYATHGPGTGRADASSAASWTWPAQCGTFLGTRHGVTFWYHLAMNFGATASVWNFNRGADALQQLLRGLLLLATGHYVDDFNGLNDAILGESAMLSFQDPGEAIVAKKGHLTKRLTFQVFQAKKQQCLVFNNKKQQCQFFGAPARLENAVCCLWHDFMTKTHKS